MPDSTLILVVHTTVALLLIGVGWPLRRNRIRPNAWYGFRTPSTLRDERIWYPVNHATGGWLIGTGLLTLPVVVSTYLLGGSVDRAALVNLAPIAIGLTGLVIHGFAIIRQLRSEQP